MSAIRDIGKFKIFIPDAGDIAWGSRIIAESNALNAEFISANPLPEPEMKISGTFICGHAPDYIDINMVDANVEAWDRLFARLRSYGVDTVFFQSALWAELNECYYRSKAFTNMRQYSTIENMLGSAEKAGIDVFLGGYGTISGQTANMTQDEIADEMAKYEICLKEISQLGKLKGFYFPSETAFEGKRDPEKEQKMNNLFKAFCSNVKKLVSDATLIISPYTLAFDDKDEEFVAAWSSMFDGVAMDILMPQDSIGTGCCSLPKQRKMWQLWKRVADNTDQKLWANVELFQRRSFVSNHPFDPVSLERLKHQMAHVTPYVEKICCWELISFPAHSKKLHDFLLK